MIGLKLIRLLPDWFWIFKLKMKYINWFFGEQSNKAWS